MRGGGYRPEGGCRAGLSPEEPPADCGLGPITVVSAVQPCPVGENSDATILSHLFSEVMCSPILCRLHQDLGFYLAPISISFDREVTH